MCDNWEFALENVLGEFVIFIGDDDAIAKYSINYFLSIHIFQFYPIQIIVNNDQTNCYKY